MEVTSELWAPAETNVSKKQRAPHLLGASVVNCMCTLRGLRLARNCSVFYLVDDKGAIHIPKPDPGRTWGSADCSGFIVLHEQVSYQWAHRGPHSSTMYLFIILLRQNSMRMTILWTDREVLLLWCGSCCSLPQMKLTAGSTGTAVKKPFTS